MILYKISYHMVLMILYDMMIYSGLCFGTWMDYFSIQLGTIWSHLTFIFCRGVGQPPTRESRYESTLSMNQDETRWYQDDNNHIQSYSITQKDGYETRNSIYESSLPGLPGHPKRDHSDYWGWTLGYRPKMPAMATSALAVNCCTFSTGKHRHKWQLSTLWLCQNSYWKWP